MDRRSSLGVAFSYATGVAGPTDARRASSIGVQGGSMYVLVVSAKVKPEQRGRFLEAIEDNAVRSVRDEPHHYLFYEVYRDQDAFAAHRDSEHFARWRQAAEVCLSEPLEATHTAMVLTRG